MKVIVQPGFFLVKTKPNKETINQAVLNTSKEYTVTATSVSPIIGIEVGDIVVIPEEYQPTEYFEINGEHCAKFREINVSLIFKQR